MPYFIICKDQIKTVDQRGNELIVESTMAINIDHIQTIEPIWDVVSASFKGTHFQMKDDARADVTEDYGTVMDKIATPRRVI